MGNRIRRSEREALLRRYAGQRESIRKRLSEFRSVPQQEYFYELAYCLLTPQTSAEHAERAIARLKEADFQRTGFDPEEILRQPEHYIRFHRTKARRLTELRTAFAGVQELLTISVPAGELRERLVKRVKGLGYKEATHFLRNIGRNEGLAILDRHILRRLHRLGIIRSVPISLSRSLYRDLEERFVRLAGHLGIPVDELDLLFWSEATGIIRK